MPKHLNGLSKSWRKAPNRSGATLVCCTISGFLQHQCILLLLLLLLILASSCKNVLGKSEATPLCNAAPRFLVFVFCEKRNPRGPTRFSQKWPGRLKKAQRSRQRERERERENHYWWEHVANSTSQVQVKAGDLWDPIYKINSRRLCMALPSSQTKSAKTAEYTVQMFKCWSAKSAGSCVLYTHRELMSALWEGQIH